MKYVVSPLRAFRVGKLNVGLDAAAKACGMSKATYARIEVGGDRMPTKGNLAAVMDWLKQNKAKLTVEQIIFPENYPVRVTMDKLPSRPVP